MPQIIVYVITWIAGVAYSAAGFYVWAVAYAITAAAAYAYASSQQRRMKAALQSLRDQAAGLLLSVRDPIAPRRVLYGERRMGGTTVLGTCTGIKNEYLHLVIALTGHEVDSIGDIYFSDEVIPLDGSGNATGRLTGFARIKKHLGSDTQTADADLVAEDPSEWTTDHRLRGVSYIYARVKYDTEAYPNGMPQISAVLRGKKVYDPRTATTAWSDNPALCIRDYLMDSVYGLGCDAAEIDDSSIIAAANICDELITLNDGVTQEKRYTCNGVVDSSMAPADALDALLSSMGGNAIYSGGKWRIYAAAWRPSVATFTMDDLRGPVSIQTADSMAQACNGVKGTFVDPVNGWQASDFPAIVNSMYLTEDGGTRSWRDLDLGFTTSGSTAQRLAKIELERSRQDITVQLQLNLKGLQIQAGDTIALDMSRYGWSGKTFEVLEWKFVIEPQGTGEESEGAILGVDVTARETASGIYDWADGEETTIDLSPNSNLPSAFNIPAPTGLTLTSGSATVIIQPDGTIVPRLKVQWTVSADAFVRKGGVTKIEYKKALDSEWLEWSTLTADKTSDFITDVQIGVGYDVRVRCESLIGVHSPYATVTNHTVVGDSTAPATPTGLTVDAVTGRTIKLKWTANTEADFSEYGIYRNTTNNPSTATLIANTQSTEFVDIVSASTTYYYWITAIDSSDNESAKSAGVTATSLADTGGLNTTPPPTPSAPTVSSSGNYQTGDGVTYAYVILNIPSNSGVLIRNIKYKLHATADYTIGGQKTGTTAGNSGTYRVDDLLPGANYDFVIEDCNEDGYGATSSALNYTTPADTTAPATPTGLTATAGTGKSVSLDWSDSTESDFQEYGVYRNTTNNPSTATKIAEQRASRFVDTEVSLGTTYYYWVTALDRSENESAKSSVASATVSPVLSGDVDPTAPSTPSGMSVTGAGIYNGHDGTVFAYETLSLPAMPSGAAYQNVYYRRSGASNWMIQGQFTNTSTQTVQIDDLTPGQTYETASQAFSRFDIPSAIASGPSFTAATKSSGPSAPQNLQIANSEGVQAAYTGSGGNRVLQRGARIKWDPPADNDVSSYEFKTAIFSDGSFGLVGPAPTIGMRYQFIYDGNAFIAQYVWVRAINTSGQAGAWAGPLFVSWASSTEYIGTISTQDSDNAAVTGFRLGGSGSVKQTAEVKTNTTSITLAGGSPTETQLVSLPSGLLYKADAADFHIVDGTFAGSIHIDPNWDDTGNDATHQALVFRMIDGTNLPNATVRISGSAANIS